MIPKIMPTLKIGGLTMKHNKALVTQSQTAALCGVDNHTIANWAKSGVLKETRIDGKHIGYPIIQVRHVMFSKHYSQIASIQ
jgi:hypothetical protein